jgi:phage protein U
MATPMIDDLELKAAQLVRLESDQAFAQQRVAGLDGTIQQKVGRRSHRVVLSGVLLPDTADDDLKTLQDKTAAGDEVSFTADITTALEIEHMVIEALAAEQAVGAAGQYSYTVVLAESPPLPPPAELSPFGGLGDFGLGDLGFDPGALGDVLGDIADQAGAIADAVDAAVDAVQAVASLAALANLDLGDVTNPLKQVSDKIGDLHTIGESAGSALEGLRGLLS